jgi:hypothetical protein
MEPGFRLLVSNAMGEVSTSRKQINAIGCQQPVETGAYVTPNGNVPIPRGGILSLAFYLFILKKLNDLFLEVLPRFWPFFSPQTPLFIPGEVSDVRGSTKYEGFPSLEPVGDSVTLQSTLT